MVRPALAVAVAALAAASPARAGDPVAQRAARALREDASVKVRAQAAFVLAQRGAHEELPALCDALARDDAAPVRLAAASALGRVGGTAALGALQVAAGGDPDPAVRAAAARALEDLARGARAVTVEAVPAGTGDAAARTALRAALVVQLQRRGFAVLDEGEPGFRLKPALLRVQVQQAGGELRVEVRASVVAIDRHGGIAAMIEGGARAKTATRGAAPALLTGRALDAAAASLAQDLAGRLLVVSR
jgi:hypothetical protein